MAHSGSRAVLLLILAVAVFRLVFGLVFPVQPVGDEMYYWDWGRRLDIGYYSKPPMIAWLFAAADFLGRGTLAGIRIFPILFGAASLWFLHLLVRDLYGDKAAFLSVLLALAMPATTILNLHLTIDAPLVMLWTAALLCFHRWSVSKRPLWLVLLCLCLGLGNLTKQMMLVFPVLAILYLALTPSKRNLLRSPGLWLALVGALLFLAPPLLWNARNEWITFRHTGHHFEGNTGDDPAWWSQLPQNLGTFIGTQLGVLSPLLGVLVFVAAFGSVARFRRLRDSQRFAAVFGSLPILFMVAMSFRQVMQPNWAAVYYVSAIALVAGWFASFDLPPLREKWRTTWLRPTLGLGFAMALVLLILPPVLSATGREGHRILDPARKARGFAELAEEVEAFRRKDEVPANAFLVTIGHRDLTSGLAWHLPDRPRVYRWEPKAQIASQYEVWPNPEEDGLAGRDALVIKADSSNLRNRFQSGFESSDLIGEFEVNLGPEFRRTFYVFLSRNMRNWPPGRPLDWD